MSLQVGKWVVRLEPGVWIAAIEGDPGRTLAIENAERFDSIVSAAKALTAARKYRPFESASIDSADRSHD